MASFCQFGQVKDGNGSLLFPAGNPEELPSCQTLWLLSVQPGSRPLSWASGGLFFSGLSPKQLGFLAESRAVQLSQLLSASAAFKEASPS